MYDLELYGATERDIDSLVDTVKVVSEDIVTSFRTDKYCCLYNEKR